MPNNKSANDCNSIEEVREQIDFIDKQIIELFAKRYTFVTEIVKFKDKTEDAIVAQERKEFVINQRSEWAGSCGLDKDAYRFIFNYLVEHNISKEMEILKKSN